MSHALASRFAVLAALACPACMGPPELRCEFAAERMGTTIRIVMYAEDPEFAKDVAAEAFRLVDELNAVFSDYDPLSELSRLCALSRERAPTEKRAISEPLFRVLLESRWLSEDSHGAFDVTVGGFTQLWRRARRQRELPSPERLAAARRSFGYRNVELDPEARTARLLVRDVRIDLGGIAMGYTLDALMRLLAERGVSRALIDGGGDVIVSNPPPGEAGWRVAIDDQLGEVGVREAALLANAAITTSGDGSNFVVIDGVRYSHLVDPRTGLGLTRRTAAVVIAKAAIDADSLATACCLLEPDAAIELLRTRGAEGRIVRLDDSSRREIVETPAFATRLVQ